MHPSTRLTPVAAAAALVLLAGPAVADPTAGLSVSPTRPAGAATTCLALTVTAVDAAGAAPTDGATVTVSIAATGTATTSFCDPATGAALGTSGRTATRDVLPSRTGAGPATARVGVTSAAVGPVTLVAAVGSVRSATATATFSAPPPPPCGPVPRLAVGPAVVVAGRTATATVTGTPGTTVQLYAATRPSTTSRLARTALLPASGRVDLPVTPTGSTRLHATQRGCPDVSPSLVVGVRSPVSLTATRLGPLRLRLAGSTGGAPAGTPVEVVSRTARGDVVLARTRTVEGGHWSLDRAFLRPARLTLLARTGTTPVRLAGTSPVRTVVVR